METKLRYIPIIILTSFIAACQVPNVNDNFSDSIIITKDNPSYEQIIDTSPYIFPWKTSYDYSQALLNNVIIPEDYQRISTDKNSFQSWLNHLPINLKDNKVYLFNGEEKYNQQAQYKVLDIDVGNKDLQQCADAVMRLRAEYLYASNQFEKIHFNYTNGVNISFSKWSSGFYPSLKGNKVVWTNSSNNKSYESFKKYINNIFMYAGTSSLEKEMKSIALKDIEAGDVLIKGGFPGHAVIVLDVVVNNETNDKCFLIAQSYMPAQNIHVLNNPNNDNLSPWYSIKECIDVIETPEWTFYPNQLKRFVE